MSQDAQREDEVPIIEIYTKQYCSYCWRALNLLTKKGVQFLEIPIDGDAQQRAVMIERANGRSTVPQVFIRGEHVGGCTELLALDRDGRLDAMIFA